MSAKSPKLWGGRFNEPTSKFVERFTASVAFDRRLYAADIAGSIAHASMLAETGVLTQAERDAICSGLEQIKAEIASGAFAWSVELEDVHSNIDSRLIELIGEAGKKLHTGRSRNDQVATSMRIWLRGELDRVVATTDNVLLCLLDVAEAHANTIMPGFTHLQVAQPITFGFHMLAWHEMLFRDRERLLDCRKRLNQMPLGAAALGGTTFPIDRESTRELLEFDALCTNALDAVSDRDFALEFLSVAAIVGTHLSRWCEELILWSSTPFQLISLPDSLTTGSSIMPQKRNPDVAELTRGKCGRLVGHLTSLLVVMKGQPLAYNRDNQEDKEPVFDAVDTVSDCLVAMRELLPRLEPNSGRMRELASEGHSTATDLADWLVKRGKSFREAHEIVGKVVVIAEAKNLRLDELSLDDLRSVEPTFDANVTDVLSIDQSVAARSHVGGTAPQAVLAAIDAARNRLNALHEAS